MEGVSLKDCMSPSDPTFEIIWDQVSMEHFKAWRYMRRPHVKYKTVAIAQAPLVVTVITRNVGKQRLNLENRIIRQP